MCHLPERRHGQIDGLTAEPGWYQSQASGTCPAKGSILAQKIPLLWLQELAKIFAANEYTRSTSDPCLFFKIENSCRLECVVFVDDLIVVPKCMMMIKILKAALEARFNNIIGAVAWDWNVTSYLGIDVQYDRHKHTLHMNVAPKLKKLFEELPLLGELTPIDAIYPTGSVTEVPAKYLNYVPLFLKQYRKLVGVISWCSRAYRPDLYPVVNKCTSSLVRPQPAQLIVLINLIRYIKEAASRGLMYSNNSTVSIMLTQISEHLQDMNRMRGLSVVFMSDTDHASSFDDPRFRSSFGNIGLVYRNLV